MWFPHTAIDLVRLWSQIFTLCMWFPHIAIDLVRLWSQILTLCMWFSHIAIDLVRLGYGHKFLPSVCGSPTLQLI